jgi:anti-sigma B factor antagonist
MEIAKNTNNSVLTLSLNGRLDTLAAPELEKELKVVTEEPIRELHLDLKELVYISSAGLRLLLRAQRFMNNRNGMKLYHVNDDIKEIFDITGLMDILTLE